MEERDRQRHINYVDYSEKQIRIYTKSELMNMTEMELLDLLPQNQTVDKYSEAFGHHTLNYITFFKISKTIDGFWNIGYYGKSNGQSKTLFEFTYVRNFKNGLADLYLMVQNRIIKILEQIRSGEVKVMLGECWDDRNNLGLN